MVVYFFAVTNHLAIVIIYFNNKIIKNPKKNIDVENVVSFSSWASLSNSSVTKYNNAAEAKDVIRTITDCDAFKNVNPKAEPINTNKANIMLIFIIDMKFLPDFCNEESTDKTKKSNSSDRAILIIKPLEKLIAKLIPTNKPSINISIATAINNDVEDLLECEWLLLNILCMINIIIVPIIYPNINWALCGVLYSSGISSTDKAENTTPALKCCIILLEWEFNDVNLKIKLLKIIASIGKDK